MKKPFTYCVALLALLLLFCPTGAFAQTTPGLPKKTVEVKAKAVVKSRGANPNIKQEMPTTDTPRAKSRGAKCKAHFDNQTPYFVKIYVDGIFAGVVGPESKLELSVDSTYKTIYCITPGSSYEWSAEGGGNSEFTFKLL
jgi:hypothetical protein